MIVVAGLGLIGNTFSIFVLARYLFICFCLCISLYCINFISIVSWFFVESVDLINQLTVPCLCLCLFLGTLFLSFFSQRSSFVGEMSQPCTLYQCTMCTLVSTMPLYLYLFDFFFSQKSSFVGEISQPWTVYQCTLDKCLLAKDKERKVLIEKKFQSSESFGSRFRRGAQVVWGILKCPGTLSRKKCNFDTDWFLQLHQKKTYGISQDKIALLLKLSEL